MNISMIGLDTAKSYFQVHAVDQAGKVQLKRKLKRSELIPFFERLQNCRVVLEACGAAHHWARMLTMIGHDVRLIAPEAAKPFVKKGKKNDAADASALCEAAGRPDIHFVPIKSPEQQGVLALHSARSMLVKQHTMLVNALRALAAEFGVTAPRGIHKLSELVECVVQDEGFPTTARTVFEGLVNQCQTLGEGIADLDKEIVSHSRRDETSRRLATIPGIGPITASLMAATVNDISLFKSGRHFAAWLGLVPRQHSTGGRQAWEESRSRATGS